MNFLRFVGLALGCFVLGCTSDDTPNVQFQNPHGSAINPSENTLNSPTTGPSNAGLSGGPDISRPSDPPGAPLPSDGHQ